MKKFYRFFFSTCILLQFFSSIAVIASDMNNKNVTHNFSCNEPSTNHLAINETFEIFEKVKDKRTIAIDIGASIGTTAMWLSNNFHHVVAVEADHELLKCLKNNLTTFHCSNVTIVSKPVMDITKEVIFGPRGNTLNESISYIKAKSDNPQDYHVQSTTFKQLIHDYVYENPALNDSKISFIKCNIKGGEENILEDVLHFAYNNNCKVYMSFHLSLWQEKNIDEFAYLFKYFKTGYPLENITEYIKNNPCCSLLFEPIENGVLVKKNMSVVIIGYNQYTFIKNMVEQVEKFTNDIIIVDNQSTYQPLLDYYKNDFKHTLLRKKINYGSNVYQQKSIQDLSGDLYVLTDPDLKFNPELPFNFIQDLIDISNYFQANRVGFALKIDSEDLRNDIYCYHQSIADWEKRFWLNKMDYPEKPNLELYDAPLDTTFCLINKRFKEGSIRVAGNYTSVHIPWHKDYQKQLHEGEYESYVRGNNSTNWTEIRKPS